MVCSMGTNQLCCGITCPQPEVDKFQPMNYQADVCSISCQNSNFFQTHCQFYYSLTASVLFVRPDKTWPARTKHAGLLLASNLLIFVFKIVAIFFTFVRLTSCSRPAKTST